MLMQTKNKDKKKYLGQLFLFQTDSYVFRPVTFDRINLTP
jgi:hypothetical protein